MVVTLTLSIKPGRPILFLSAIDYRDNKRARDRGGNYTRPRPRLGSFRYKRRSFSGKSETKEDARFRWKQLVARFSDTRRPTIMDCGRPRDWFTRSFASYPSWIDPGKLDASEDKRKEDR